MTESTAKVKVVLVEDHGLLAEALAELLASRGYVVTAVAVPQSGGSARALLSDVVKESPHVVLLDLDLGWIGHGEKLLEPLTSNGVAVIVLTGSADRARWGMCLYLGAWTVLHKTASLDEVAAAVGRAHAEESGMGSEERQRLLDDWNRSRVASCDAWSRLESLTRREGHVLEQLMAGRTVGAIAQTESVSLATVRTQVKSLLAKLGVNSQIEAVGVASKARWTWGGTMAR